MVTDIPRVSVFGYFPLDHVYMIIVDTDYSLIYMLINNRICISNL